MEGIKFCSNCPYMHKLSVMWWTCERFGTSPQMLRRAYIRCMGTEPDIAMLMNDITQWAEV